MRIVQGTVRRKRSSGIILVNSNFLSPLITFTRPNVSTLATFQDASNVWQEVGPDVPRFNGPAQTLLVEQQRTNSVRNPRAEGGTNGSIGSGGVAPTNWTLPLHTQGVTITTTADVLNGVQGVYVECVGTTTAAWNPQFSPDNGTSIVAANGQTWAHSVFAQLVAGTWPWPVMHAAVIQYQGGTFLSAINGASILAAASNFTRHTNIVTLNNANVDNIRPFVWANATIASGTPIGFTIFVGWPQLELATFASTPILPAVGTPAASVRGDDRLTALLSDLGIPESGACTILGRAIIDAQLQQIILNVHGASFQNGYEIRTEVNGAMVVVRRIGGVATTASAAGVYAAGASVPFGITIDGAGRAAMCAGSSAVIAVTGGPTSGLTTLRIGSRADNAQQISSSIAYVEARAGVVLSDVELLAAVAAIP